MVVMPSVTQNGLHVPRGHVPMLSVHVAVIRNDTRSNSYPLPIYVNLLDFEPLKFNVTQVLRP